MQSVATDQPASKGPSPELVATITEAVKQRDGRREGREWRFRCPEGAQHHNGDKHPSARWNEEKACWRCDVCGVGGGALDLARRLGLVEGSDRRPSVCEKVYAIR